MQFVLFNVLYIYIHNIIRVIPVNEVGYKEGTEVNKTQQISVCPVEDPGTR